MNVLVIGASGDIGQAISNKLLEEGYDVFLHYNQNYEAVRKLLETPAAGSVLAIIHGNLASDEGIRQFTEKIDIAIDAVVFASGRAHYGLLQETTEKAMDDMIHQHVKAPWQITKHLLPDMICQRNGHILFITSIWGEEGASNEVIYSAVKGAQNSFIKALSKEVGPSGVRVNGVSAGFIDTKMNQQLDTEEKRIIFEEIPLQKPGLPRDIAETVSFLLHDRSGYIHGEIIRVTGGW